MPLLDPAVVVLSSPMLIDKFDVRRRDVTIAGNGRSKNVDILIKNKRGIVAPGGDNGSERTDDAATGSSSFSVVTRFRLRKQAEGIYPDVVLWHGLELLVIEARDYTGLGKGWVEATCTSDLIADKPIGG